MRTCLAQISTTPIFYNATLTGANLTGASITGADFHSTTDSGFTQAQFESTASYASGELTGLVLTYNDLTGWNFADKKLAMANFKYATLSGNGHVEG